MPEVIAASRSAPPRCWPADMAISRPSEDTAMASRTPAVSAANLPSSQLKFCASALSPYAVWLT
jgi:hypothetical protein